VARPAIVVALPLSESTTVSAELLAAGFEVISVEFPRELGKGAGRQAGERRRRGPGRDAFS